VNAQEQVKSQLQQMQQSFESLRLQGQAELKAKDTKITQL